jgi:hypothetical protein
MKRGNYKKLCCRDCGDIESSHFKGGLRSLCVKCSNKKSRERYTLFSPEKKERYKTYNRNRYRNFGDEEKQEYINKQGTYEWMNKNLIRYRVLSAKHRAKKLGIEFSITTEIIEKKLLQQNYKCYISNIPLTYILHDWHVISIDRLDSSKGYTPENSVLVTKFVNTSKNELDLYSYINYIKEVYNNL